MLAHTPTSHTPVPPRCEPPVGHTPRAPGSFPVWAHWHWPPGTKPSRWGPGAGVARERRCGRPWEVTGWGGLARPSSHQSLRPAGSCLPTPRDTWVTAGLGGHRLQQQLLAGSASLGYPSIRAPVPSQTNPAGTPSPIHLQDNLGGPRNPRPSARAGPAHPGQLGPPGLPKDPPPHSTGLNTMAFTWQTLFFSRKTKTNVPSGLERAHRRHGKHVRAINMRARSSTRRSGSPCSGV